MAIPGAASAGPDGVPTDVVPAKPEVLHLPDLDKMSPKAAVQFFVEMEGYPDAQRMMDEYDVAELEAILGAVLDYGKKQYGDGFQVAGVEYADDETNDGKEKKLNARTKMALDLLKMDLGSVKPAEPAPTPPEAGGDGSGVDTGVDTGTDTVAPPSAPDGDVDDHDDHDHGGDDAETGPDADGDGEKSKTTEVVETAAKAKEDAEGQFAAFSDEAEEILSGDGSFFDKSSKVMELAGEHGTDFLDSVGEARDAAMKAMEENQDKGGFAAFTAGLSAFMKTLSASMGSRLEKRKKKKEKKESKEDKETLKGVSEFCDAFGMRGADGKAVEIKCTDPYGKRLTPKGPNKKKEKEFHKGIDWRARTGTEFVARSDVKVKRLGGQSILVEMKGKIYKLIHVEVGEYKKDGWSKVKKGEVITTVKSGDNAHLHLETEHSNADPSSLLSDAAQKAAADMRKKEDAQIADAEAGYGGPLPITTRGDGHSNDVEYFDPTEIGERKA